MHDAPQRDKSSTDYLRHIDNQSGCMPLGLALRMLMSLLWQIRLVV